MQIYFLFILFNHSNIFITLTDVNGHICFLKSIGMVKTKGLKKLTPLNIKNFIIYCLNNFKFSSEKKVHVNIKGFNKCKKLFLKILFNFLNTKILSIHDKSLQPNNGCKPKKNRRL